ncbi:GNAT family N-acetyltransferase [Deinococcus sp. QL22]|uniref:GNAT family N-acetyltransferase n=1 Tax=Deinococcus sp. QL22 TaxID=2939437 RepID=UPI0020173D39|nr:GNAT family N-acetyltransferase [Deinococcus sp. QL22]UQN07491.1 GNAT family N-acetyltransferase [Deinococcus sp. QL22]
MTTGQLTVLENGLARIAQAEAQGLLAYAQAQATFGPITAIFSGAELPVNIATLAPDSTPTAEEFRATADFFESRGVQASVQAFSNVDTETLAALAEADFALTQILHVYLHPLTTLPDLSAIAVQDAPPELWTAVACRAFGPGSEAIMGVNAELPNITRVMAWLDDQPAGVGLMGTDLGVAMFFSGATLSEQRRRGVQSALLTARLHLAAQQGADLASVNVTPGSGSERNIRRARFVQCGARLRFEHTKLGG